MYRIYVETERNSVCIAFYLNFSFEICKCKECKINFFNAVIFKMSFSHWKEFYAQFPLCISWEKMN